MKAAPKNLEPRQMLKTKFLWQVQEQAGAELGQAQLKLGLDFNSINLN